MSKIMEKVLVVTAILVNDQQNILVEKHASNPQFIGLTQFPGGKVEKGESLKTALIRELKEELNIKVTENDLTPFSFTEYKSKQNKLTLVFYYLCYKWQGNITSNENQEIEFVSIEELQKRDNLPFNNGVIQELAKKFF